MRLFQFTTDVWSMDIPHLLWIGEENRITSLHLIISTFLSPSIYNFLFIYLFINLSNIYWSTYIVICAPIYQFICLSHHHLSTCTSVGKWAKNHWQTDFFGNFFFQQIRTFLTLIFIVCPSVRFCRDNVLAVALPLLRKQVRIMNFYRRTFHSMATSLSFIYSKKSFFYFLFLVVFYNPSFILIILYFIVF